MSMSCPFSKLLVFSSFQATTFSLRKSNAVLLPARDPAAFERGESSKKRLSGLSLAQTWGLESLESSLKPMGTKAQLLKLTTNFTERALRGRANRRNYGSRARGSLSKSLSIDSFGAWDSATTSLALNMDASLTEGKPIPKISIENIGTSSVKGRRSYQEDAIALQELLPGILYMGIYDGHGGSECSNYCAQYMGRHIQYWLEKGAKEQGRQGLDMVSVLHSAFIEANNSFSRWFTLHGKGPEDDFRNPGTTATVCLLRNSMELVVGHVGDSRAILCRNGEARKLTIDHVPDLVVEKTRIEKSGGTIKNNRVNGRLAMTRSIGDLELKKYGVVPQPEVKTLRISHSRDAFIVLTTDGINNVMTDQEIVDTVKQADDPVESAHLLTDTALQYCSEDNISVVVIPLGSWGNYSASATIFHSFGKSFSSSSRFG